MAPAVWKVGAGSLCAATGLALHLARSEDTAAQCYAAEPSGAAAAAAAAAAKAEADLAALADWLRQQGADIDAIQFKASETDVGRYGVYAGNTILQRAARGWLGTVAGWAGWGRDAPIAVAAFPLEAALTAANLARDPRQGPLLAELQQLGLADERTAVILHLAVERARLRGGAGGGALAPWLAALPAAFSTSLFFSELDMQWLRGTTLHKATRLRQKSLREAWARLAPAAQQLAQESGAPAPSLDDWLWANSIFWSRAIAFPAPDPSGEGGMVMQEGIVPGLDFCNHDAASPCKWTVYGAAEATATGRRRQPKGPPPSGVSLVCPRRWVPRPGSEVTINYGDKSNEELLFLYGFAQADNPAEVLTLMCPLPPPGEWDEQLRARLALLAARGLRPQLHLPAADLGRLGGAEAAKATAAARAGRQVSADSVLASDLPEHVLETLEVFVMTPAQVAAALEAAHAGQPAAGAGGKGSQGSAAAAAASELEVAGQRMALLTTLVRLLEVKALEMEGREEGTGPLEQDEQLLEAAGRQLPRNQRHALLYRIGQKRLARTYLAHAKQLLQQEMAHLAKLQRDL